jgi:hypothetical protein
LRISGFGDFDWVILDSGDRRLTRLVDPEIDHPMVKSAITKPSVNQSIGQSAIHRGCQSRHD